MASGEEPEHDGPSLELPTLGFGRKRRQKGPDESAHETADVPAGMSAEVTQAPEPAVAAPEVEPEAVEPEPEEPIASAPARPRWDTPAPRPVQPAPPPAPTFVDEVPDGTEDAGQDDSEAEPESADQAGSGPRVAALAALNGMTGALLTGMLIGAATVGLTWGSLHLCEVVQGTSSCGNPGYLLLLAIMAAMTMLGAQLLRLFGIPDAPSTSFLAIGLLAVLALLLLVDVLLSWWMIIVIPLFSMATFALAHWVTTSFTEEDV